MVADDKNPPLQSGVPHPAAEVLPPVHPDADAPSGPRILARETIVLSPWVSVIKRTVDFGRGEPPEDYHAVHQADYVSIWPMTPDGQTCLVRQYRPAIESFTLEFPAGIIDGTEDPAETCVRELKEETGLIARRVHHLGRYAPDGGRLGNRMHSYFVETEQPRTGFEPEKGMQLEYVSFDRLMQLVRDGALTMQIHLGVILLALLEPELKGILPTSLAGSPAAS